jgi:hypothetical protein
VLKLSPKEPEYRRDMLYNVNPVGMVAFLVSAGLSIAAFFGLLVAFGALLTAYRTCTCLCINTNHGLINQRKILHQITDDGIKEPRYDAEGTPVATVYHCRVCEQGYERPDIMFSHKHNGYDLFFV